MYALDEHEQNSVSGLARFWQRLPVLVRAVITGLLVTMVGTGTWMLAYSLIPAPWSVAFQAVFLLLYVRYFSGHWWPRATAEVRKESFRSVKMTGVVWKWSLLAVLLYIVIIQSVNVVSFRIIELPIAKFEETYGTFQNFPLWINWLIIIISALSAGVIEEIGFRGYMQVPLEKRFGPVISIVVTTVFFVILHFNQAWAPFMIIHLIVMAVLWGALTYASDSLIPSIIAHTIQDIIYFSYWFTGIVGRFEEQIIAETGIDTPFIIWTLILVISLTLFFWIVRNILVIRQ
jgi:membrane protease YdiL (CAAX protease family)